MYSLLPVFPFLLKYFCINNKNRCEAILRSEPDSSGTVELHLACVDAMEEEENLKKIATGGTIAVAAVGLVLGIAGMLLKRR